MGASRQELRRIIDRLYERGTRRYPIPAPAGNGMVRSVVAFLLRPSAGGGVELLLTRRSDRVRQPGDLCCPGGGAEPAKDALIARLLGFPGFPLNRWPLWKRWRSDTGAGDRALAGLTATALRESFEEIRLQPFGVRFLGMLPPQELVLFKRAIYPVVCWVPCQRRFWPNWEVDAIVSIPIAQLLAPDRHVCYRLRFTDGVRHPTIGTGFKDFPGFRYTDGVDDTDVLWGATFRMALDYLRIVHGFAPPELEQLPVVNRTIGTDYLTGNGGRVKKPELRN